ncbi:hypothetical protein NKH10_31590 [Mesorhizobium sp. M1340]|uniref:hypothetical protein n=1 Tax=unclassified Mesorhizobium TaxID=325217 RepID=UPI003337EDD5
MSLPAPDEMIVVQELFADGKKQGKYMLRGWEKRNLARRLGHINIVTRDWR